MKNLKVGKKLFIAFCSIFVLFIVSITAGLLSMNSIKVQLNQFYESPWVVRSTALSLKADLANQQGSLFRAIATTDSTITNEALADVDRYGSSVDENLAIIEEHFLGDAALVTQLKSDIGTWSKILDEALAYNADAAYSSDDISAYMQANALDVIDDIDDTLDAISNFAGTNGDKLILHTDQAQNRTSLLLITMCSVSILIGILFCINITRGIVRPLAELRKASDDLANGNLKDIHVDYESKDELGEVSDSMRTTVERLSNIINDLKYLLNEISNGNFRLHTATEESYVGEFHPLLMTLRRMNMDLSSTIGRINQSADQVAVGSEQVSSGAQALSQGAAEQASSVEELASTINNISEQVKSNAISTQQAKASVDEVDLKLTESNQQMQEMTKAMDEISASSNEIGKIIKTIEDIAFQTNILALNAAVEAARAGAAGKGFAVVADEVRNLASKSSEASKSTATLIESSLKAVASGAQIANETAASLFSVVEGTAAITAQINQIADASDNQANSITQVTQVVEQISNVVQTNSATAEESAAASEELSGQSQMLKSLVSHFVLKDEDVTDRPTVSYNTGVTSYDTYDNEPVSYYEPEPAQHHAETMSLDKY